MDKLNGSIVSKAEVRGSIVSKAEISGNIQMPEKVPIHDRLPDYEGSYEVIPKITSQTLPTKDTSMIEDVQITAIPYQEVDNISGGKTATIGFE